MTNGGNSTASFAKASRAGTALIALACACGGVGSSPAVQAPSWERAAIGADTVDFVGAIDLEALRADPVFGPIVEHLARRDDMGVLMRASQIDAVATVDGGNARTWIAVVHGVDGPPRAKDVGSSLGEPRVLPSGVSEYPAAGVRGLVVWPGAWIVGEGAAFDRVLASRPAAVPTITMPSRALVVSTTQGRAIPRQRGDDVDGVTDGLTDATFDVLGGSHLELVLHCRYVDRDAARAAATEARVALLAMAERDDLVSALARALVKVDFDVSSNVVTARVTVTDELRDLLRRYAVRGD
jgi:hypothetical protein